MNASINSNKTSFSIKHKENKKAFREGMQGGIPIGLGYFAVSFSLGIAARNAGMTPFQSFLTSMLENASAGEYAGFTLVAAGATYLELAIMTFIANARYLLMSCAMSQRIKEGMSWYHRLGMAFYITDEIFAISIARPGFLNPAFTYGAALIAAPCWAFGTALGCIAGNMMPIRLVSAFSVALFGMFLAVIIPPARHNKIIAGIITICFAASYAASRLPGVSTISSGTRTIFLTVIISAAAAILFPKATDTDDSTDKKNASEYDASKHEVSNHDVSEYDASKHEVSNHDVSNHDVSEHNASKKKVSTESEG